MTHHRSAVGGPGVVVLFGVLAALLVASVALADLATGPTMRLAVLALAAVKVALVASEYVEVRGSARWLVAVWWGWGSATFVGLAVLSL